jgi:hypothetical protein
MTTLFDPYDLAGLRLPNRIVMAPMTRSRATPDGLATPSMAKYYAQRASAGLMISEGVHPSRRGQSMPLTPGLHSDEQVESWKPVTEAVHANGGRIFAQIMHSGRVSRRETSGTQPVGPSAIAARDTSVFTTEGPRPAPTPHALTAVEVAREALSYAAAARHASAAGFDGVELHGANGYLSSFRPAPTPAPTSTAARSATACGSRSRLSKRRLMRSAQRGLVYVSAQVPGCGTRTTRTYPSCTAPCCPSSPALISHTFTLRRRRTKRPCEDCVISGQEPS